MSATETQETALDIVALRSELKIWENNFLSANGRKAGREDIRNDATIAVKYQLYSRSTRRSQPAAPSATPKKSTRHIESTGKTNSRISATPKKTPSKARHLAPELAVPSPIQEVEATPAFIRAALGPTPQKDGQVLGIFDLLPGETPSRSDIKAADEARTLVAGTPSKPTLSSSDATFSKTPLSSGKRFFLDAFVGTPLKRKREDDIGTASSSKRRHETPAFLRRSFPLAKIDEENTDAAPTAPPFRKRGLVRSLSSMIQGLRKQQEQDMDDDWDIMQEIEEEEAGGKKEKPAAKVLVQDSQAADMPLGPDQAQESSEESAAEGEGTMRKPWKKKGLKRQTRRVNMKPNFHKPKKAADAAESEDEVVAETQLQGGDDDEFADELAADDDDETGIAKKAPKKQMKSTASKKKDKEPEKKTRKFDPNAVSHANFRSLKIKNKNSKAGGRGKRFGRR